MDFLFSLDNVSKSGHASMMNISDLSLFSKWENLQYHRGCNYFFSLSDLCSGFLFDKAGLFHPKKKNFSIC